MAEMENRANLESRLRNLAIASWVLYVFVVAVSAWNAIPGYKQVLLYHRPLTEVPHHALRTALFWLTAIPWVCVQMARKKAKARLTATDRG